MKKSIKSLTIGLLIIICILSLFGCRFNNIAPQSGFIVKETAAYVGANGFNRASMKTMAAYDMVEEAAVDYTAGAAYDADVNGVSGKKLIKTVDISSETKEFDKAIEFVKSYVESYEGIIDNSYIDAGNKADPNYRKNAHFSIRVPAESLDSFLCKIGDNLSVTFQQESVRDVTDAYDDTEQRKKTLLIEEEKLNELLKKAKTVEELVSVESKLSEVRYEIQNIENRLKRYDRQIDYSTINISIQEVRDLTDIVEKEDYSKSNLIKMLNKNLEDTKNFVIKTGVFLFTHIPAICLILICVVIVLIIIAIIRAGAGNKEKENNTIKEKSEQKDKEALKEKGIVKVKVTRSKNALKTKK